MASARIFLRRGGGGKAPPPPPFGGCERGLNVVNGGERAPRAAGPRMGPGRKEGRVMSADPARKLRYVIELDETGFSFVVEIGDAADGVFGMRLRDPAEAGQGGEG